MEMVSQPHSCHSLSHHPGWAFFFFLRGGGVVFAALVTLYKDLVHLCICFLPIYCTSSPLEHKFLERSDLLCVVQGWPPGPLGKGLWSGETDNTHIYIHEIIFKGKNKPRTFRSRWRELRQRCLVWMGLRMLIEVGGLKGGEDNGERAC